ncbi:MAG: hypothetical protein Kow0032_17420 [Methyloligellaceae bacterium]
MKREPRRLDQHDLFRSCGKAAQGSFKEAFQLWRHHEDDACALQGAGVGGAQGIAVRGRPATHEKMWRTGTAHHRGNQRVYRWQGNDNAIGSSGMRRAREAEDEEECQPDERAQQEKGACRKHPYKGGPRLGQGSGG